jgi:hypothetical protein
MNNRNVLVAAMEAAQHKNGDDSKEGRCMINY